jgi:Bacterial Ig-like domain/Bacterial Ig domain
MPRSRHFAARRRAAVVLAVVLVTGGFVGGLIAYFSGAASAGSAGGAAATYVGAGTTPATSGTAGRSVTLTWSAATLAGGQPVDGYLVTRYEADPPYAPQLTEAGCGGTIPGLTCTEYAVPFGSWQYTITPVKGANWRGLESPKSGAVTVGAASLTLDQSTLDLADFGGGLSDAALTGSLAGFASDEGITFKLDDPSSGTTLSGSPANANGSGSTSVSIALTRPSDGSHSIYAVGDAAYPSQASASILVDTSAPTSSASGNDADWHASDVTLSLSATDGLSGSGVKQIEYQIDGGSVQTIAGSGGDVTISAPANHSNDGTLTISFDATDNAGNVESPSNSVTVKIDTTKPSSSVTTSPASPDGDNGWFKQASVDVTLNAADAGSGVAASYYAIDGGAAQTYTGAVAISTQGDHRVTSWSVDGAGNIEDANSDHVKVDNVNPSTSSALNPSPPDGSNGWYVSTPALTLTASDSTSGVASSSYQIDGGSAQAYSGPVPVPDGQHTVTYWSVDNAGNQETHNTTSTIKVDTVDPTGTLTAPGSGDNVRQTIAVSSNSADGTSGVESVQFQRSPRNAGSWTSVGAADTSSPYSVNLDTTGLTDGQYDVRVITTDNAGRTTTSPVITIRVDNTPPTVTPTVTGTLGTDGWYTSNVEVGWATSDSGSGIATTSGCSTTTVTSDTAATTFTCSATDNAGNSASHSVTIKRDATNPSVSSADVTGTLGTNGWYTSNVQVSWPSPTDATSGIASTTGCSASNQTVDTTGTTLTCSATDNAGNTDSKSVTIKRDATNPAGGSITANGSAVDSYNKTGTVPLAKTNHSDATSGISGNAITRAHATLSGNTCGGFTGSDPVTISGGNDADTLTNGCYRYTLTGTDDAGNGATTQSAIVKVDTSSPTGPGLSFSTSGSGVYYPGSGSNVYFRPSASSISFTVSASSTDGDSGVASYSFPSVSSWTLGAGTSTRTYTHTSGGTTQTNRPVTATNNAGGTSPATSFDVTVDSTAPSVSATAIADQNATTTGSIHQGASYYLYANVSESGSGINTVTGSVTNITTGASSVAMTTAGGPWTFGAQSYNYRSALQTANSSLAAGSKTFTVTATDNVANSSGGVPGSVTVDNTAPSVTLTAPANNSFTNNPTPTFTGACSNGDGNVTVTVKQGGSTVQTPSGACSSGSYSISASALGANSYTAQASQTDAALNTGTSSTNTFTIDLTTPTVGSVSLVNNGTAGKVEAGDAIVITFSEQMGVSSFCSAWTTGDANNQSINGNNQATVTLTDGGGSSDAISVSSSTCTFNFGSISLGNTGYVIGGNATFSGSGGGKTTIAWNASTRTLTVTLGSKGGAGTIPAAPVASSTATYNPSSSITDSGGNSGIASKSTGNVQQF